MEPSPRLPVIKAIAANLGLTALAQMEAQAVRTRRVPPRLLRAIAEAELRPLSPAERETMVLLASGYSRDEIAMERGVTLETVKSQLQSSYKKLGVHRQIEAVNAFIEWEA